MLLKKIEVKNFRLLRDVTLSVDDKSTVIVGRNNSGKTSLTEVFTRFLGARKVRFFLEDFSLQAIQKFNAAFQEKEDSGDEEKIRGLLPEIELGLIFDYTSNTDDFGLLGDFIIDFDESSTEIRLKLIYRLADGKINDFFTDISCSNNSDFFRAMKERIPSLYSSQLLVIDPTDEKNSTVLDIKNIYNLLSVNFINAQRGLDDETQSEKDVLGKILGSIFKNANQVNASQDMKVKSEELEQVVSNLQSQVDSDFTEKLDALLPALKLFGYPGLSDPNLRTETTLNVQNILESNTKIRYKKNEFITLPETYNGLGSRNLIYILFQLFEFFRKYQSNKTEQKSHIIFIEEPEAHLHPQMQEVFIRKLDEISNEFSESLNGGDIWPVQFIVSTHSSHIANEAHFDSIRYFLASNDSEPETKIKDLSVEFNIEDNKKDREFIHKYLTLTRNDLLFADKAIMVEGTTERILLPKFIEKAQEENSTSLDSQYLSIIEIGGAYAHHFYKFLDFLELKTLIITDLDSTKQEERINKKGNKQIVYTACEVSQGTNTSNYAVKNWFSGETEVDLKFIREIAEKDKQSGLRFISYQIPEEDTTACGRSFEDAFILANKDMFEIVSTDENQIEIDAFKKASAISASEGKANFALKYALDVTEWNVPKYIEQGLEWLASNNDVSN